jgi:glyoxylase-like metal-dependent hydrolase (beta-lactamase superfamily II)
MIMDKKGMFYTAGGRMMTMKIKLMEAGMFGTNCYIVTDTGTARCAIVDPGGQSPAIDKYVEKNELTVESVILTHGHCDHTGGVPFYLEKYHALLYAHEAERPFLTDVRLNFSRQMLGREIVLEADVYVKDGDEIMVGEIPFKVIHTPGHTPGGICLLAGDILISGDTLFNESIGRTDFPYGDTQALLDAIRKRLFVLPDEVKVYPGHMGMTNIGHEKRYNPFAS